MMAYFDHAASSPMTASCREAMLPWLGERFGNPSGSHAIARAAREAIEDARDDIADILAVPAREIVFTGGGTEAINLAIAGTQQAGTQRGSTQRPGGSESSTIITSAIEHDAVREAAIARTLHGEAHVEAPVDHDGVLHLDSFSGIVEQHRDTLRLVAVMAVNNEVGTIQPVEGVVEAVRRLAPTCLVLIDAVQGAVWLDPAAFNTADLTVISAHKFGGPQGVGALRVKEGTALSPILHGGGQERERRSGTQNVAGIVGMAAALRHTHQQRNLVAGPIAARRDRLVDGLLAWIPDAIETSRRSSKVAGNAHLCVGGVESESLLVLLDDGGICASAGSACASGAIHTSPVLAAMGVAKTYAEGALRLTLGSTTSDADVERALAVIPAAVESLRARRPIAAG